MNKTGTILALGGIGLLGVAIFFLIPKPVEGVSAEIVEMEVT